ncbi:ninja-family protein 6-like isoform X2 [Dendrobium catenatum]|uniref:Ninja-family protein n=1 Tax=Dendrobium catenatum TaxID=906689 RepID=A0A2I0W8U2_9ASPA|nr:ninja-family protein 6-like isoform X2 [Dendrobium catenatum]PKU72084.1 Ninja-family protein 3 [Dendrobium catenatum]
MKTEAGEGETQCMLSSCRSRDLLLRFSGRFSPDETEEANGSDSDEIELGLSLGGCFNSAKSHKNRILRSASIPAICEIPPLFPLFRTCSLPVDEMQRKMEAKRKREESRNFRRFGERVDEELEEGPVWKLRRFEIENEGSWIRSGDQANGVSSPVASRCIAGASLPSTLMKGVAPALQGSVVSEGSNSSGGSEMESRSGQGFELSGFSQTSEIRSPSRFLTNSEQNNHKSPSFASISAAPISKPINGTAISNGFARNETLLRKSNGGRCSYGSGEIGRCMQKQMPLVSTKVDGPNSRRIEGFLYEYGIGEEVRIVCVCHGSFFTPAEFVKHAGGGEVAYPLRHIVVNPNPNALC